MALTDLNTDGRPNPDRTWTECFAQLVGTVLSLWDAAELDTAGEDGEVLPKFINLTDASIKMVSRNPDDEPKYDWLVEAYSQYRSSPYRLDPKMSNRYRTS